MNFTPTVIELYVQIVIDGLLGTDPLHKDRGKVPEIIGMKERTASRLISELLKREFIESDSKAGAIRLKIGASMASYIFPMLVPEKDS